MANELLLERSKLFAKYAEKMPKKFDKVDLQLDYPEFGWIDIHFKLNGEEKALITASEVYEPFEDIRIWLEEISSYTQAFVAIYDEFDYYYLYYEPLIDVDLKHNNGPKGLFYIYNRNEKLIVADGIFETRKFVRSLYDSITTFAKEASQNKSFVENWIEGAYNSEWGEYESDDDPRVREIFINKVISQKIECYLKGKDNK